MTRRARYPKECPVFEAKHRVWNTRPICVATDVYKDAVFGTVIDSIWVDFDGQAPFWWSPDDKSVRFYPRTESARQMLAIARGRR